jgi:riboflavin transporter FmnP
LFGTQKFIDVFKRAAIARVPIMSQMNPAYALPLYGAFHNVLRDYKHL